MEDKDLDIKIDRPLKLESHQEWICNYLDRLNEKEKICPDGVLPSDLIKGALAVVHSATSNPDWMAQSAHSYRELLYRLGGQKDQNVYFKIKVKLYSLLSKFGFKNNSLNKLLNLQTKREKIGGVLEVLHEQKRAKIIANTLYKTHLAFTKISHHFAEKKSKEGAIRIFKQLGITVDEKDFPTEKDFNNLVQVFENTLKESSLDPLKIHEKIDAFLKENNQDASYLWLLFSLSYDAKRYFFSQANETRIEWLWKNGFLDEIKKKAENTTSYSYRLSELEYLLRMVNKNPIKVAEIITSASISEANFNPEVVDRFMWIIGSLPAEQIKTLTAKIRDEKWVYLMRSFRKSGYEFTRIVEKLVEKRENDAILELAQAMLLAKSKAEMAEKAAGFGMDDPFYASDLDASGIFEALEGIDDLHKEKALQITTAVMSEIVKLATPDDSGAFQYSDLFSLYDVDIFTLEIEDKHSYSYREDIKNLAAIIKKLIEGTIGKKCDTPANAKRLFEYIDTLPTCRATWRLRMFALSQCPTVFKTELKAAFFKLFEVENYYDIEGGTEYKKTLKIGFYYLDDADQRTYVAQVFSYFSKKAEEHPDQAWHKRTGWEIISSICTHLTVEEAEKCEEIFGSKCDAEYTPQPSVGKIQSGFVAHRSPVNVADYAVDQIIANLKSDWSPEKLKEQFKDDDFLSPRGVEGLGDSIKEDVKKRTDEYLSKITSFFDRDNIHPAYVYSLLRGIEEMLRNKQILTLIQIEQLLGLCDAIKKSGEATPFRRKDDKSWLADWIEVHKVITDALLYILENKETRDDNHKQNRIKIKDLISYLLSIKDSPSKEHEKPEYGEPYHVAINSVRGRAYEAFVVFTENDGKTLADDTKALFKQALADDSLAVRFVIGRYLATFYFRDKEFVTGLLPEIFPKDDPAKKDLYLASWEGYLSNTLYDKLFIDLSAYYSHAITLDPKIYTGRKYSKGLDESLAVHIALAFAHLGLEIEDSLFQQFWSTSNSKRYQEFISFIGRSCLIRDQAGDEWLNENKVSKDKLLKFWDWALENVREPEPLAGFGFWINPNKEVLSDEEVIGRVAETLEKSNGDIDWDYGLMRRLPVFAQKNGEKTLEIIQHFLLDSTGNLNQNRRAPLFNLDNEIKQSLDIIYKAGDTAMKQKVIDLINLLIEKGNSMFWNLKEVINGD
ncbi:MAG: hypothetical protein WC565_02805 [Parcubacteria group bacterium]